VKKHVNIASVGVMMSVLPTAILTMTLLGIPQVIWNPALIAIGAFCWAVGIGITLWHHVKLENHFDGK